MEVEEGNNIHLEMENEEDNNVRLEMENEEGNTAPLKMETEEGNTAPLKMETEEGNAVPSEMEIEEGNTVPLKMENEEGNTVPLKMEIEEGHTDGNNPDNVNNKRRWILGVILGVVFGCGAIGVIVGVTLHLQRPSTQQFRSIFIDRCEKYKGKNQRLDCHLVFSAFEQAYVGKSSCNVPIAAYDPLMAVIPLQHPCNETVLWSKTKDLVHKFTENKTCFILRDTLLGSVLDGLTWCGEEGSNDTITEDCPGRSVCETNPVSSFWSRASASFADYACDNVTAMLNGSIENPFDPNSTFGKTELLEIKHPDVKYLNVILLTRPMLVSNCTSQNLRALREKLDPKVDYTCTEVTESHIQECASDTNTGCGACLLGGV